MDVPSTKGLLHGVLLEEERGAEGEKKRAEITNISQNEIQCRKVAKSATLIRGVISVCQSFLEQKPRWVGG